jgi:cystathionine beta-lyase
MVKFLERIVNPQEKISWWMKIFPDQRRMLMPHNFDQIIDRHGSASIKWDKYQGRDIIPLWVADMDFAAPPAIMAALQRRVAHGIFGYTHAPQELIDAVVTMLQSKYDWTIQPEWLIWLPGVVTGLNVACRAVGDDGDGVMLFSPVYRPFFAAPINARRALIDVPLTMVNGRWSFDLAAMNAALTPRTKLLLLCHPHNPVGRIFDRAELTTLVEFCARHNLIICSDEIHNGLILDSSIQHIPTATLAPAVAQRTITLMAPSKTFNIPGLGCSFAIIPDAPLRQSFRRAMDGIVPYVNLFGYSATLAAFSEGGAWLNDLLDYLRTNRDLVRQAVNEMPGLSVSPVEATYLAWIDTRASGLDDPAGFFEAAGVGLSDGRDFRGPGFVRLNFACPRSLLSEALERMKLAWKGR